MLINQAVIVCGGLGTRLGDITKKTPKPLIKINRKTILEHLIKNLSRFGFREVLLLCYHKKDLFIKKFHNKTFYGIKTRCIIDKKLLGTSASLLNAKKFLERNFLFCNGDTFFDINIYDLVNRFSKKKFLAFVALKKIENKKKRYDGYNLNKKNFLRSDKKKYINTGVIIFSKKIIKFLKKKGSLEKDVYPEIIKQNKMGGKIYKNDFIDMGTPKDLKKLPKFLEKINFKPAVFLDRDGVINKDIGYLYKIKDVIWRKDINKYIKKYNDKNYYIVIITNQSGVGRGYYKEQDVIKLHSWIENKIRLSGGNIDKIYFAPYYKDSKFPKYRKKRNMRKPNIGMILRAKNELNINLKKSILIGDNQTDKLCAIKAGIKYKILQFGSKLI